VDIIIAHWQIAVLSLAVLVLLLLSRTVLRLCGVIVIPDDSLGVITKR